MVNDDTPTGQPMPAFEMLLGELQRSCNLSDWQARQMRDVFRGYAGEELHVPAAASVRREESCDLVRRMLGLGMARAEIVQRLICRGHSRFAAYRIVRRVMPLEHGA